MKQLSRHNIIVDPHGHPLRDPVSGALLGRAMPVGIARVVWALPGASNGALQRYRTHPPAEKNVFMLNLDMVVRKDVSLTGGSVSIFTNTVPPVAADADWVKGPVAVLGRAIYATLSGGTEGKDYQLRWSATDSEGNVWPRTTLVLVSQTS
jgi:hypothetical protein